MHNRLHGLNRSIVPRRKPHLKITFPQSATPRRPIGNSGFLWPLAAREPAEAKISARAVAGVAETPIGRAGKREAIEPVSKDRKRTIRVRLLLTIGGVTTGACVLFGVSTSLQLRAVTLDQAERSLLSLAQVSAHDVSAGLDFDSPGSVRKSLSGLFGISEVRFARIVRPDNAPFVMMGESPPPAYEQKYEGATSIRQVGGMLIAVAPIRDASNTVIGDLVIGYTLDQTRHILVTSVLILLLLTVALAAISVMIGHTLGKWLTTPMLQLTEAAKKLAAGKFDEPLTITSNDEVGILARTFNTMSREIQQSRRQVEQNQQELEGRIRERTEELRQKNIALEMQTERALDASRLKSSFLANVSHELRTPLNAILALSELMKDGIAGELSEEQHSHISMIHNSGSGLLRLINDVLDLSKIEAGHMELRPIPCDILNDLKRVAIEMQPLAATKRLDMRVRIGEGPRVRVDADRVRQILVNLLGNAIKFTERGYVEIDAGIDSTRRELMITVRDTGIGIAPEDIRSIFQEFRQADGSPTRRFGGTGLGLTISSRLVDMMQGTITVESSLGRGSHFKAVLPVDLVDAQGEEALDMPHAA
jgi:signal transduction histidine kinase